MIARQVGPLVDEKFLFLLFVVPPFEGVSHHPIIRRQNSLTGFDLRDQLGALRMNQRELQLRYLGELLARFLDPLRAQARNLNEDTVLADRADDRFARSEFIDALTNYLHRLVEEGGGDFLFSRALKFD